MIWFDTSTAGLGEALEFALRLSLRISGKLLPTFSPAFQRKRTLDDDRSRRSRTHLPTGLQVPVSSRSRLPRHPASSMFTLRVMGMAQGVAGVRAHAGQRNSPLEEKGYPPPTHHREVRAVGTSSTLFAQAISGGEPRRSRVCRLTEEAQFEAEAPLVVAAHLRRRPRSDPGQFRALAARRGRTGGAASCASLGARVAVPSPPAVLRRRRAATPCSAGRRSGLRAAVFPSSTAANARPPMLRPPTTVRRFGSLERCDGPFRIAGVALRATKSPGSALVPPIDVGR